MIIGFSRITILKYDYIVLVTQILGPSHGVNCLITGSWIIFLCFSLCSKFDTDLPYSYLISSIRNKNSLGVPGHNDKLSTGLRKHAVSCSTACMVTTNHWEELDMQIPEFKYKTS